MGWQKFVRFDVSQHEKSIVLRSLKRKVQKVPNRAMCTIATNNERGGKLYLLSLLVKKRPHMTIVLNG